MYLVSININQVFRANHAMFFQLLSEIPDQAGCVFVPILSLSGHEGPLNQINQTFLFPLTAGHMIAGLQAHSWAPG